MQSIIWNIYAVHFKFFKLSTFRTKKYAQGHFKNTFWKTINRNDTAIFHDAFRKIHIIINNKPLVVLL